MSNEENINNEQPNFLRSFSSSIINESKNLKLLKKGDYSVHILVEEVKSLKQLDKEILPYPVVKLTCFNKSQRTEKTDMRCKNYIYDEHFYFEKADLTVEQLDSCKIIIEVFDLSHPNRKDYFGIFEFDIEFIYNFPNHVLSNHLIALSNPESENMTEIRGYLKLSISALHESDPRVELKSNPNSMKCLFPSQTKADYIQLKIFLIKGEEFPDMGGIIGEKNVNRRCNPYVEFHYFGLTLKSKVSENIEDVSRWNQIIYLPVHVPIVSQKIVLLIKDKSVITSDDNIGSYEININDIINEKNLYEEYRYIDIYGSYKNAKDKYSNIMNSNAEIGSSWNGRILLKILYNKSDKPCIKTSNMSHDEIKKANSTLRKENFIGIIKLYSGYYLPKEYTKYKVKIGTVKNYALFYEKQANNQYIEWEKCEKFLIQTKSADINELPDIFFYLLNTSDKPVCFQRIKASNFYLNKNIMIIKLFPELSYGNVSSIANAGLLKLKLFLYNTKDNIDKEKLKKEIKEGDSELEQKIDFEKMFESQENTSIKREKYTIVCIVYMCKYLISNDKDGNNNPYVKITCLGDEKTTSVKHGTINGIWNEKIIFDNVELRLNKKSKWPILLVEVLDYTRILSDKLIGSRYIWLSNSSYSINKTDFVTPKWSQLYLSESDNPQGQILLSFYIFDSKNRKKINQINPNPPTKKYIFDINILGLRDMKPLGLLPIKKAFIKFELNSLNINGDAENDCSSKTTQPINKGSNPIIKDSFMFEFFLPESEVFMPQLQCIVYDHILSGLVNPILGIFLINLKRIIKETNRQIDEDIEMLNSKIENYLNKGDITNKIGELGNFDKNIDIGNKDDIIDTSSKQNLIDNKEEEINIENDKKFDEEKEIRVNTIVYDSQFIEKNKNNSEYFVVLPQYKDFTIPGNKKENEIYKIEDESKAPSNEDYFPIGYIEKPDRESQNLNELIQKDPCIIKNITKHYRRYYKECLEKIKELKMKSPFYTEYIRRGKDIDEKDDTKIFTSLSDIKKKIIRKFEVESNFVDTADKEESDLFSMNSEDEINLPINLLDKGFGKFKAIIRICEAEKMKKFEQYLAQYKGNQKALNQLKYAEKYNQLKKSISIDHQVVIRVYILELRDLPSKDLLSDSDPYIKIYFGDKKKFDESKNHKKNEKNSKWYKYYDICTIFPGDSTLRIEVWNYNSIFKDDLIGSTSIDLEDRYFNYNWQQMKFKPIETRNLYHPDIESQQGNILLWVEIFDKIDSINTEPWNITPEPPSKLEIRLVIWEAKDMIDDEKDIADIYINAYIDQKDKQSTDIHFRCQNGNPSFNWRIVLQLEVPRVNNILTLQCYDKDIFSRDDFMCGAELDLSHIFKIVSNINVPIYFTREYVNSVTNEEEINKYKTITFFDEVLEKNENKNDSFYIQCYKQDNTKSGSILCSLEVLPIDIAELNKVGKGRDEPNVNPTLFQPFGRLKWSWNPLTMFNQYVGPKFRKKFYTTLLLVILIIYFIFHFPSLLSELAGNIINPFD